MVDRSGAGGSESRFLYMLANNERMQEVLKLTPDQVTALQRHQESTGDRRVQLEDLRRSKTQALAKLVAAEKVDRGAVMAAVEETGQVNTELAKLQVEGMLAAREILTQEQLAQARTHIRERMNKRRASFGSDRPRGPDVKGPHDGAFPGRRRLGPRDGRAKDGATEP